MKNLLIYVNPTKSFANETWGNEGDLLAKVQIDNSLSLGWKREDILLVTNFPYEYNGVKAIVVKNKSYCKHSAGTPSKINVILDIWDKLEDDLYWFHDFDAFQLEDVKIDLDEDKIALTDYGVINVRKNYDRWSTGSIFFRKGSKDVFKWIKEAVYKYEVNEEVALLALTRHNKHKIRDRIVKLNITYNFATRRRNIVEQYKITDLPIKVIHFHPFDKRPVFYLHTGQDNMAVCVYGKSPVGKLVTDNLIKVFKCHQII